MNDLIERDMECPFPNECAYLYRNREARSSSRGTCLGDDVHLDVLPTPYESDVPSNDPIAFMHRAATVIAEDPYLTDEQRVTDLVRLSDVFREIGKAYSRMGRTEKAKIAIKEAKRCIELARTSQVDSSIR